MIKRIGIVTILICTIFFVYNFSIYKSINKYCFKSGRFCIHMTNGWKEVRLLTSEISMSILDAGYLSIVKDGANQMDVTLLTEKERAENVRPSNPVSISNYKFGKAQKIDERTMVFSNPWMNEFFKGGLYLSDYGVIIRCSDMKCLESIEFCSDNARSN